MVVQELVKILQEMTSIHHQLLELAHFKKDILVKNDVAELNATVNKETKLLKQLIELEEKRKFETDRYVVGKGYRPHPSITVAELVRITTRADDKTSLTDAQEALLNVIKELDKANRLNQELAKQSMAFIDYSLNILAGVEMESTYHNPQQQSSSVQRKSFFDTKA